MLPSISIIVPVYKAEKYLDRCVSSILSQTFSNWELLLVDDGSPDNSGRICDHYAASDGRIHVFHKPNGGVSSARGLGMQNAIGEYSIHVDPDDWIEETTLELLYYEAKENDSDVVIHDFLYDYGTRQEISKQTIAKDADSDTILKSLLLQKLHGSLCNKLIRTDLYARYNLRFPEQMVCWEDLFVCCSIFCHPVKVSYLAKALYHYDLYSNDNSMVRNATSKTLEGMMFFCAYFEKHLPKEKVGWLNETKGLVLVTAYRCKLLTADEIRNLFPEVNSWYIARYINDYDKILYNAVARVLNGSSIGNARRFQLLNIYYHGFIRRIKRMFI